MKTERRFVGVLAVVLLTTIIVLAILDNPPPSHETPPSQAQPILEAESAALGAGEGDTDWLEAHESNGPEGMQGIPMQRLTRSQSLLAILILLAGSTISLLPQAKPSDTKDSGHE